MPEYSISTERTRLDLEFIVRSLRSTYWAGDRSREDIVGPHRGIVTRTLPSPTTRRR